MNLDSWKAILLARGHRLSEESDYWPGLCVSPDPDTYITVALEQDPTLKRQYRQRYFVCEPEPERVFRVTGCPEPFGAMWLEMLSRQPPCEMQEFLAGPGSWTLSRLVRFQRLVVWARSGLVWESIDNSTIRDWGLYVPVGAASLLADPPNGDRYSPRVFGRKDNHFVAAVAACFLFPTLGWADCYLADEAGTEVYLAHHHNKVVASVPIAAARRELLDELESATWLFTDESGYNSPMDDEIK
jgi:hypothetical protein